MEKKGGIEQRTTKEKKRRQKGRPDLKAKDNTKVTGMHYSNTLHQ